MNRRCLLAIGAALFFTPSSLAFAGQFDHSSYDAILRHYVDEEGLVDYDSIRLNSLTALESYFERMTDANLAGLSVAERTAFWINAYNAHVLYGVAQKPGMKKISEDLVLFDKPFKIAGQSLTLNDIEHRILRDAVNEKNGKGPITGLSVTTLDPRIHFALVNGALSGPKLRNFAYTAENLHATLQMNAVAFANSYKYVSVVDGHLQLSSLLKWYADDFKNVGGVQAYLISLLIPEKGGDGAAVRELLKTSYGRTTFVYDWTVNAQNTDAFKQPRHPPMRDETTPTKLLLNNPTTK